jgi:phthalate 4,5-dioxygenase
MVLIRREVQRAATFSGAADFVSQDFMLTGSMGPVCDRAQEQLDPTGRAINRCGTSSSRRRRASPREGTPAIGGHDYRPIFGAERVLAPGQDWRRLAIPGDRTFAEVLGLGWAQSTI